MISSFFLEKDYYWADCPLQTQFGNENISFFFLFYINLSTARPSLCALRNSFSEELVSGLQSQDHGPNSIDYFQYYFQNQRMRGRGFFFPVNLFWVSPAALGQALCGSSHTPLYIQALRWGSIHNHNKQC